MNYIIAEFKGGPYDKEIMRVPIKNEFIPPLYNVLLPAKYRTIKTLGESVPRTYLQELPSYVTYRLHWKLEKNVFGDRTQIFYIDEYTPVAVYEYL